MEWEAEKWKCLLEKEYTHGTLDAVQLLVSPHTTTIFHFSLEIIQQLYHYVIVVVAAVVVAIAHAMLNPSFRSGSPFQFVDSFLQQTIKKPNPFGTVVFFFLLRFFCQPCRFVSMMNKILIIHRLCFFHAHHPSNKMRNYLWMSKWYSYQLIASLKETKFGSICCMIDMCPMPCHMFSVGACQIVVEWLFME